MLAPIFSVMASRPFLIFSFYEAMNASSPCLPSDTEVQTPCRIPKKLTIYAAAPATLAA
jgi:hypothetical protein